MNFGLQKFEIVLSKENNYYDVLKILRIPNTSTIHSFYIFKCGPSLVKYLILVFAFLLRFLRNI